MARWSVLLILACATTATAGPLDKPAFSAKPGELIAAAKAAPDNAAAVILRYDLTIEADMTGRFTQRAHLVYVVKTQAGIDDWSELFYYWRPFFQDKPTVRMRVIAPDASVAERPRFRDDVTTKGGDRHKLVIEVPPLQIGSVVEEEVIVRDREPMLGATGVVRALIDDVIPSQAVRAVFKAPVARKLQLRGRNLGSVVPRHETAGTMESWTYDFAALPANHAREHHAPSDVTGSIEIYAGTAASWNAVARELRAAVDKRIAEAPVALPPELPTTPTLDTARAIAAWVHRKVSYNNVDLRESALVPATPAATLKRGIGDAKDIATLLVALLRQANLRADLALIERGPDDDIEPGVPGFTDFDQVLVRVMIGGKAVWIEAAENVAQVGILAAVDEGRKALVIADDTTALVDTPRSRSTDNTVRDVRVFEIAENGNARVTSTIRVTGALDLEYRKWIRDTETAALKQQLTDDIHDRFVSKDLERFAVTPPLDFTRPFELVSIAKNAQRASTDREVLKAYLFPSATAARFHDVFEAGPRKADFVWVTPHVFEIENRLIIPDSFDLPTPKPTRTRKLGTMTFTHDERLEGRTYIVTFRLDTGKARISAADYASTTVAMAAFEDERIDVKLDLTALRLEREGKYKEAVAEIARLIKLHPKEAVHHSQLVPIYIRAGQGTAARREARKAVQLEPNDADAHVVLAWALRRDSLGREYGYDHDRAGALAALARARKLDPTHFGGIVEYAQMLETGASGRRYDRDADVRAAIVQWRAAEAADDTHPHADDLVRALLYTEQYKEAELVAADAPVTDERDQLLVAATAGAFGVSSAVAKANQLRKGAAVNELLDDAAAVLFGARSYDLARAIYGHTGKFATSGFNDVLVKLKQVDLKPDRADPQTAVREAVHLVGDLGWPKDALWNTDVAGAIVELNAGTQKALSDHHHALIEDLGRAIDMKIDGTGPWRIEQSFLEPEPMYVVRERGVAKVFGWRSHVDAVGEVVLKLLARNEQAGAFQLLDWIHQDVPATAGVRGMLGTVWANARTKDAALLAGALMAAPDIDAAIPILRDCKTSDLKVKRSCKVRLGYHLLGSAQAKAAEAHARAWLATDPTEDEAMLLLMQAVISQRKLAEATKLVEARLSAQPGDELGLRFKATIRIYEGKLADAIQIHDTTSWGRDLSYDLNESAWLRLLTGKELDKALAAAHKAVDTAKSDDRGNPLHTLAAIEAEVGDLKAANATIQENITARFQARPEPRDWYVYGRIAEQLGLTTDAADAYRRVTPPKNQAVLPPNGVYELAQRRLKALRP